MFKQDVKEPSESFFWPAAYLQKSEPDDEEEGEDNQSEDDPLTVIFMFKFTLFNFWCSRVFYFTRKLQNVHIFSVMKKGVSNVHSLCSLIIPNPRETQNHIL